MFHASPTLLLAAPEPHLLHTYAHALRGAGYHVLTARTAPEALAIASAHPPDLLIANYTLPHSSGLELAHHLHTTPTTSTIPTILLTAPGYSLAPATPAKSNIRKLLPQPLPPKHLLATVHHLLARAA